jgi:hypothetical protein
MYCGKPGCVRLDGTTLSSLCGSGPFRQTPSSSLASHTLRNGLAAGPFSAVPSAGQGPKMASNSSRSIGDRPFQNHRAQIKRLLQQSVCPHRKVGGKRDVYPGHCAFALHKTHPGSAVKTLAGIRLWF